MRGRHGSLRRAGTGLPDAVVEAIIVRIIAEYGHLDVDAAVVWMLAERDRRRWGPRLRLVERLGMGMRESCPTGAA